ncbi:MAG: hypothetical protein KME60_33005 [Cyanomargarita calcarea GSE-NOS-MK-12-04C]|jgi:uncharacterized membrane protein|uniref:Uncharacterized protein n=1 Tax=Cyanomargarita calcarea GSE-NOS-MK-12-04C TaxID=2839659 RepID=A0A951UWP8_9CYAN|nr:hypothetical protein [Cyanomargarita calcarea GSE-NOS-MK-12-04C]
MHIGFLIPLLTALFSGYLFKKITNEIAYLAGAVAVFCILLSLILAPWEIQLFVLIIVLVVTKKLLQQNESKMNFEQTDRNHKEIREKR